MPDMTADNVIKDNPSFGLQYAKFIEQEWLNGAYGVEKKRLDVLRSHMEGSADASHLKKQFVNSGDLSTLSINWNYSSDLPRFIAAITESMSYDQYRTSVKGIDMFSSSARSNYKREKEKDIYGKELDKLVKDAFGYDFSSPGNQPKSIEELNLYMELGYKLSHEIALELGIQKVYDINDWREVFNRVVEDLALCGKGIVSCKYDPYIGVAMDYEKIDYMLYSRDTKHSRDGRGRYYFGKVMHLTVQEVEKHAEGLFSAEQIRSMVNQSKKYFSTYSQPNILDLDDQVEVMHFCFKANRYEMMKKKGNNFGTYKYIPKPDDYLPFKGAMSTLVRVPYEVWYEGYYVVGTDIIFGYKVMDNMIRNPQNKRKVMPPYIMYELSTESIGNKLVSLCDDIYVTYVKIRQLQMKMKPKGWAIDISGLGTLEGPDGTVLNVMQQVKMLNEDGTLLYNGKAMIDESGSVRLPIHDMPSGDGREFVELVNFYNSQIQRMHEITGISQQAVGAAPPARTSAGVYQGTLNAAQRVVNNIYNGLLSIQQRTGEAIVSRLQSASLLGETKSIVENILGEYTSDQIAEFARLHEYSFLLNVSLRETEQERASLREDLSLALQTGAISLEDKIDIEDIENLKLARQTLKLRQQRNKEEAKNAAQQAFEQQMAAENAKSQAEMEMLQFKSAIETQAKLAEIDGKAKIEAFLAQAKLQQISLEKQWEMAIKKIETENRFGLETYKEDRKDSRTEKQATQQSRMIDQRQNQTGAMNFEKQQESNVSMPQMPELGQVENITQ